MTITRITIAALLLGASGIAGAQQVYRIVGPDGKVTFSDRAPTADAAGKAVASAPPSAADANAGLPLELKQAAGKFPLTLYTSQSCAPCDMARRHLQARGVPYTEKTITSNEEIAALQRMSGDGALPFATLGGQKLSGFSSSDWDSYLDAAGYPKASVLPRSWRQPAATALIPKTVAPAAPQAAAPAREAEAPAAPSRATPDNPNGIIF
ncbi:MAG: DUF4124 domain-containing protein [Comamonas sp.]